MAQSSTHRLARAMIIGAVICGSSLLNAAPNKAKRLEPFDIKAEPKEADWREFLRASESARKDLWTYQSARGKKLGDWAWGWRLGWVRSCAKDQEAYCDEVLLSSLKDDALVVRAEGATKLGRKFEKKENAKVCRELAAVYKNPKNQRQGKPLYVQQRVLYAMKQIGGKNCEAEIDKIATDKYAKAYLRKLGDGML